MIDVKLLQTSPTIMSVTFSGRVTKDEISQDRRFGDMIKSFAGAPFSVLCDCHDAATLSEEVTRVFMAAQSFAVERGMLRDAFVNHSAIQQMQFSRIAKETGRAEALGPLAFFATVDEAMAYLRK